MPPGRSPPTTATPTARDAAKVSEIIEHQTDLLHASDAFGNGPIHWAVLTRQFGLIDTFLDAGADIDARRADGQAPVHLSINGDYWFRSYRDLTDAAVRNPWVITGYLLARGARMDLCVAAAVGDHERVKCILAADTSLASRLGPAEKSPLGYAARAGYTKIVKTLLDHGADPNMPEQNAPRGLALFEACAGAHLQTVELLLNHGADPNAEVDSSGACLTIVEHKNPGNFKPVQALLNKHGATNPPWNLSREQLATALQDSDPVIGARGRVGTDWGSFLYAILREDDLPLLALYIDKVGDADIRQLTATYVISKTEPVIDMLVEHGLDVNQADWLGRTFLHKCAAEAAPQVAAAYLKHGADINATDLDHSETPLGTAARLGRLEMVRFLLDRGAVPNLPADCLWARPLAYAEAEGHSQVAAALRQGGATA